MISISIHAPRAGCDHGLVLDAWHGVISIHAPRAGCDAHGLHRAVLVHISIHAPRAGCDVGWMLHGLPWWTFQSTHPVRGATLPDKYISNEIPNFNPRTPCGVRRAGRGAALCAPPISIHAPRAGCDRSQMLLQTMTRHFNPRTPCGVRLREGDTAWHCGAISIHAPRAGCDDDVPAWAREETQFQSTHPVRGATRARTASRHTRQHFNPRTPCGVRRGDF